jgi:hypothetical protein
MSDVTVYCNVQYHSQVIAELYTHVTIVAIQSKIIDYHRFLFYFLVGPRSIRDYWWGRTNYWIHRNNHVMAIPEKMCMKNIKCN